MPMKTTLFSQLQAIHQDEDGIEALQVVMITAIGAIILLAVMTVGQDVYDWCVNSWLDLSGKTVG
jgi:hypothetical protein